MKKKKNNKNKILPALLATVYTVPYAAEAAQENPVVDELTPRNMAVAQAISQEVVQLLRNKKDPKSVIFNIAGREGVHFKVYYSPTDEEGSYKLLAGAEGVIGEDGMAKLPLKLKDIEEPIIYIKVHTSDSADFSSDIRITPEPLGLILEEPEIKLRGGPSTLPKAPCCTAVAGVRG